MRGEKYPSAIPDAPIPGSPPHARGKVTGTHFQRRAIRITPACAGKRPAAYVDKLWNEDHPRMRGEKFKRLKLRTAHEGSPPHARGKAFDF